MTLELELAVRFLRRRTGVLLRGTALAALAGVALATAALVITLALMNGYRSAIATALQRGNAHMVGFAPAPMSLAEAQRVADEMATVDGVVRAVPVTYLTGLIDDPSEPTNPLPVVLKAVADPPLFCNLESWPEDDLPPAVFGDRLASILRLEQGESATVRLPPSSGAWVVQTLRLRFAGRFKLEFTEFDSRWIVVPLARIQDALPGIGVAGVEVELTDPMDVERAHRALELAAPDLILTDWREMNAVLFAALRWQTLSLFVVLSLVVAVAAFQVSSALVVLAIDKRRSTGMLLAVGARPATVRRILVLAGAMLGGMGIGTGLVLGSVVSLLMSWFEAVRFPEGLARVYMVDHIPLVISPVHLAAVAVVCSLLVLAASWWPAWRSSRLDPVASLKAV